MRCTLLIVIFPGSVCGPIILHECMEVVSWGALCCMTVAKYTRSGLPRNIGDHCISNYYHTQSFARRAPQTVTRYCATGTPPDRFVLR